MNQTWLNEKGVNVIVTDATRNLDKNSISATVQTVSREALVLLWETGECDIHLVRFEGESNVEVAQHEFNDDRDLNEALTRLIDEMSRP